jgi:hypothetical protein
VESGAAARILDGDVEFLDELEKLEHRCPAARGRRALSRSAIDRLDVGLE